MNLVAKKRVDYLIVLLLIINNGNNPFRNFLYIVPDSLAFVIWGGIMLLISFFYRRKIFLDKNFFIYNIGLFILLIFQTIILGNTEPIRVLAAFTFILYPLLSIRFLDRESLRYFPLAMVKIVQFSIIFFIPYAFLQLQGISIVDFVPKSLLFSDIPGREKEITHFIVYNLRSSVNYNFPRNSGMYWEPGAFSGTILITYVIFIITSKLYTKKEKRKINIWLAIGIFTAASTTGLLIFPFLVYLNILNNKNNLVSRLKQILIILPIAIILFLLAYQNIPMLGEKITEQLLAVEVKSHNSDATRFGTMLFLLEFIQNSPFIGKSFFVSSGYWDKLLILNRFNSEAAVGNGMFFYLAKVGIPFFILVFGLMWNNIKSFISSSFALILIFVLLMLLQGENWMGYPLIYSFLFIGGLKYGKNFNNYSNT